MFLTPGKHLDFLFQVFSVGDIHNESLIKFYQDLLCLSETFVVGNDNSAIFDLNSFKLFGQILFIDVSADLKSGAMAYVVS